MTDIHALAERLDDAARTGRAVPRISDAGPLDLQDAYRIRAQLVDRRLARGETLVGLKLGPCTAAGMAGLGLSAPLEGFLTDAMDLTAGGRIDLAAFVAPRAEVEIAFRLAPGALTGERPADPRDAVEAVSVALEIADSRYQEFRFGLPDLVADNCCAAGFALGPWLPPAALSPAFSLAGRAMRLRIDGATVDSAGTDDVLGDPWAMAAHGLAAARQAGAGARILLSGSPIAPRPLAAGQIVQAEIDGLGSIALSVDGPAGA